IFERVGYERFLKPEYVVVLEHLRGVQRPLVAVLPVSVAAASVHHELVLRSDGFARGADDRLVGRGVATAKRPPPDLERTKALRLHTQKVIAQLRRFVHEQRRIWLHALPVTSAEQSPDRLPRRL